MLRLEGNISFLREGHGFYIIQTIDNGPGKSTFAPYDARYLTYPPTLHGPELNLHPEK